MMMKEQRRELLSIPRRADTSTASQTLTSEGGDDNRKYRTYLSFPFSAWKTTITGEEPAPLNPHRLITTSTRASAQTPDANWQAPTSLPPHP